MIPPNPIQLLAGNSHPLLAQEIAQVLSLPLSERKCIRFQDGEIAISLQESVRSSHVFLIQPLCPPVNESLMEMLILIDALKRASALEIIVVTPYYAYARQDRKVAPREPITAKLVADLLEKAGATRVITMDLHAGQIQGFFNIPVDHVFALPIFIKDIRQFLDQNKISKDELVIVSPDAGGVERARAYAKRLECPLAIIDKRRPRPNVAEIMNIIGDIKNKHAIIIDDMIDTAGTLVQSAKGLKEQGALSVRAYASHGVLSGDALSKIQASHLREVVITNSIFHPSLPKPIRTLSCGPLMAEVIKRVQDGVSISDLFV